MSNQFDKFDHIIKPFCSFDDVMSIAVDNPPYDDDDSSIRIYIYSEVLIPVAVRLEIANAMGRDAEIDNTHRERTDTWTDRKTGATVEIVFRKPVQVLSQMRKILLECIPSLGGSTVIWRQIKNSVPVHDPRQWYQELQETVSVPYPAEIQNAIIVHNHSAIKGIRGGYLEQFNNALHRADVVRVNSLTASILDSYFDILFAVNKELHPGGYNLIESAKKICQKQPRDFDLDVKNAITSISWMSGNTLESMTVLMDRLDDFLQQENLLPV